MDAWNALSNAAALGTFNRRLYDGAERNVDDKTREKVSLVLSLLADF